MTQALEEIPTERLIEELLSRAGVIEVLKAEIEKFEKSSEEINGSEKAV